MIVCCHLTFQTLLQPVRLAHSLNLSHSSRVGSVVFRMQVAEGCSLAAPTSQNPMSNLFRNSEFLVKSNRRKWFQIWNFLLKNVVKSQSVFMDFVICSLRLKDLLPPLPEVRCPFYFFILFKFFESLGKSNGKKWSQIVKLVLIKGLKSPTTCYL